MNISLRSLAAAVATVAIGLSSNIAAAADNGPCGNFDFSAGISCKIEVEGGCAAQCTPLKFEAGCKGGCTTSPTTTCTGSCGEQCILECDPSKLDCFQGCHDECDQPTIDQCKIDHPDADCVTLAKATCDNHCEDACQVPDTTCSEHCKTCCSGGCSAQINFDCDFSCFAELQGGCDVQCSEPSGAIFCNGQYVHASDVKECITYLATKGIDVDASAQGSVACGVDGCDGIGDVKLPTAGCSTSPTTGAGMGFGALALMGLAVGLVERRRRR